MQSPKQKNMKYNTHKNRIKNIKKNFRYKKSTCVWSNAFYKPLIKLTP